MNLLTELRTDVLSGNLFPALSVGLVVGVIGSAYLISVGPSYSQARWRRFCPKARSWCCSADSSSACGLP